MQSCKWLLAVSALGALALPAVVFAENASIPQAYMLHGADSPVAVYAAAVEVDHQGVAAGLGDSVDSATLDKLSGGTMIVQNTALNGTVSDNTADHLVTGDNTITGGSVAGATGFPTIIQNSGNNVLIQNATVLNVEFKQ